MEFTNDISFNENPMVNKELEITYNGFLSNSNDVWVVYGFGDSWENTSEVKMERYFNGFYTKIKMLDYNTFNFCFKNANNEWDNNNSFNYITPIKPNEEPKISYEFDMNTLIEEMLKPLSSINSVHEISVEETPLNTQEIDLGVEITKVLSQIDAFPETTPTEYYSNIDEILSGSVFDETPIELFEKNKVENNNIVENEIDNIVKQLLENTKSVPETTEVYTTQEIDETEITTANTTENDEDEEKLSSINLLYSYNDYLAKNIDIDIEQNELEIEEDNDLDTVEEDTNNSLLPSVSIRKLSKFYLMKKRIKLALYKAFIKIPNLILGKQED